MELTGNLSLMDGEYDKNSFIEQQTVAGVGYAGCTVAPSGTSSICPVNRSAEELPQLPKIQYNLGATQVLPTSFGRVTLHVDYAYLGEQFYNPVTPAAQQSQATKDIYAAANAITQTPGYGLVNARFAIQFDAQDIEFAIYGKNLTGKNYNVRQFADVYAAGLGFATDFIGEPTTYGASLTKRF
jgi:hypothetical protein